MGAGVEELNSNEEMSKDFGRVENLKYKYWDIWKWGNDAPQNPNDAGGASKDFKDDVADWYLKN